MSEQDPLQPLPEEVKRTETSLMLDEHFKQCSIPAGNTKAKAYELLKANTRVVEDAFVLDKSGFPEALEVRAGITSAEARHPASNGLRFALATPKTGPTRPRLIAFFGGDLAVQVATFEDRKGDRCNYIQIGQESTDAAIIMGTNDHSRLEYVYAIKALLSGDHSMEQLDLLSQIAIDELDKIDKDALHSQRLEAIYRKLSEQLQSTTLEMEPKLLLLADGEDTPSKWMMEGTFPDWNFPLPLGDGREAKLVLLQNCVQRSRLGTLALRGKPPTVGEGNFVLAIKTAQDIAVPLYTFSQADKTIYEGTSTMQPIDQAEINALQQLIYNANETDITVIHRELEAEKAAYSPEAVKERLDIAHKQASETKYPKVKQSYHAAYEHIVTAQAALEAFTGMPVSDHLYFPQPATREVCETFMQAPYRSLDLSDELTETIYVKGGVPKSFDHGLHGLIRTAELTRELQYAVTDSPFPTAKFIQQANIREKVTDALGEHQPPLNTLIARLDALTKQKRKPKYHGVYQGYRTPAGEVDFHVSAEISQKNGTYKLRMYLIPVGQEGKEEPGERFDGEISRVRPNTVSDDNAEDLHDLLKVVL